jgi:ABC-type transport system involved in multi-copper enzyme maturation permease subunit
VNAVATTTSVPTGASSWTRNVAFIALNTYRETVRDKVLYNLVLFALIMISSSYVLGKISVYQEIKIIKDLGLAAIAVFGMVIAIFIGIGLVSKEIERRTLYSLLPKPISRVQFLLGKYFGLCLTLLVNVIVMAAGLHLLLFAMHEPFEPSLLKAIYCIYLELAVLVGVAILFSTFTSSILAGLFTGFVYVTGYFSSDLKNLDTVVESAVIPQLTRLLYYLLPNFKNFDIKAPVVAGDPVSMSQLAWITAYALAYILFLLTASSWIFQKRNLK